MPEIDDARGRPSEGSFDDLVAALAGAHVGPADLDAALQARGITGLPTHTRTDLADTLAVVQALRAEPALADPSPAVWDRISADLAHEADVDASAPAVPPTPPWWTSAPVGHAGTGDASGGYPPRPPPSLACWWAAASPGSACARSPNPPSPRPGCSATRRWAR